MIAKIDTNLASSLIMHPSTSAYRSELVLSTAKKNFTATNGDISDFGVLNYDPRVCFPRFALDKGLKNKKILSHIFKELEELERVHKGTRLERVPQSEGRGRNETKFLERNGAGTNRYF